jgi:hypothetical protein
MDVVDNVDAMDRMEWTGRERAFQFDAVAESTGLVFAFRVHGVWSGIAGFA